MEPKFFLKNTILAGSYKKLKIFHLLLVKVEVFKYVEIVIVDVVDVVDLVDTDVTGARVVVINAVVRDEGVVVIVVVGFSMGKGSEIDVILITAV
jgi:hypothetical protein